MSDYHKVQIQLEFGKLGSIVQWCKHNCMHDWAYEVLYSAGSQDGEYSFLFLDETDYINFILWQK